ncbi:hypothetical protein V1290_005234 [Bradyrhizobium sp. AZCC 1578]|uniref:hypothetical protein n=1 Tax=unclassified Bradyrhizobium TaxID=2631580 RepID=UPI002FF2818E
MNWRSAARKASLWILGSLGAGILIAKAIEKWGDRIGYLDDPSNGFQWALAKAAAVTEQWFFYPALTFLIGLAIGLWVDALFRSRSAEREAELALLGYDLREFSDFIVERAGQINQRWPTCISDRMPDLQALLNRAHGAGLPAPPPEVMQLSDDGEHFAGYLRDVGTFLINNQFAGAKNVALHWNAEIEKYAASRQGGGV